MIRLFLFLLFLAPTAASADCVVLLHGLARSDLSMTLLQEVLTRRGYAVVNPDYASTEVPIGEMAEATVPAAMAECPEGTVHFVTHSLGGILVRRAFLEGAPERLGRVVMMGPPNQGSQLAESLDDWEVFGLMMGPAGRQLGTGPASVPLSLPGVDYPVGVIAGNRTLNPVFSAMIDGPDDGKVGVEETELEGMAERIVLPVTHTFMMNNPVAIAETIRFLEQGSFAGDITWAQAVAELAGVDCSALPGCEENLGEDSR